MATIRKKGGSAGRSAGRSAGASRVRNRPCMYCQAGVVYVDYKDYNTLRRFISDRGKIRARRVTGLCPQHQRDASVAVKRAREMALLPYVGGK